MNEEAPNDGIYIGCEMVCVETVRFHGYIAIDVGTKVVVNGYDGVDLTIATDTANHPLNPYGEWKLPKKYFKLIKHKEPTPFSFTTNSNFITVQQMRNALSHVGDGNGVFEMWNSGVFGTVWTYKEKEILDIGNIVNHKDTDRNGVVYKVDDEGIHVRFWNGGREVFRNEALRLIRGD